MYNWQLGAYSIKVEVLGLGHCSGKLLQDSANHHWETMGIWPLYQIVEWQEHLNILHAIPCYCVLFLDPFLPCGKDHVDEYQAARDMWCVLFLADTVLDLRRKQTQPPPLDNRLICCSDKMVGRWSVIGQGNSTSSIFFINFRNAITDRYAESHIKCYVNQTVG